MRMVAGRRFENQTSAEALSNMSDAFNYFRAHAVRALCKARAMPRGKMKRLQMSAGRIYHLLTKESAYGPNTQRLEDFRAAQLLEKSLDGWPKDKATIAAWSMRRDTH